MIIKKGDKWKRAFQTQYGYFEYPVILFVLSTTPASFQGYMNKIPAEKLDFFIIVYLDNIFIYTEDPSLAYVNTV